LPQDLVIEKDDCDRPGYGLVRNPPNENSRGTPTSKKLICLYQLLKRVSARRYEPISTVYRHGTLVTQNRSKRQHLEGPSECAVAGTSKYVLWRYSLGHALKGLKKLSVVVDEMQE
jgi:hypothetical protein